MNARRIFAAGCAALLLLGITGVDVARAADLACGAVVTSDIKLEVDLTCTGSAIIIAADDVTVNLNGHTLTGTVQSTADPRWSGVKTLRGTSLKNVRVVNGTIVGFNRGIDVVNTTGITIQNVVITDPIGVGGILVERSTDVAIRNVVLKGGDPQTTSGNAIFLNSVAGVHVQNVDVQGFVYGVRFWCNLCTPPATPNSGSVRDSTFRNNYIAVSLIGAANVTVAGNYISHAGTAVGWGGGIGTEPYGPAKDLRIVDNTITDSNGGVFLGGVTGSWIAGNTLLNNVYVGIALHEAAGVGSTGNKIASNTALGNGVDLFHDPSSAPNVWVDNVCQTSFPGDIVCSPAAP